MKSNEAKPKYQNRVIEIKRMRVGDVAPNPSNWKIHPEKQKKALDDILSRIGIAGVLPAYYSERNDYKLTFIDGHARRELDEDALWDIAILDITDDEADLLLSVYDPIAEMAVTNQQAFDDLLKRVQTDSEAVMELISNTAEKAGMYFEDTNDCSDFDREPDVSPRSTGQASTNVEQDEESEMAGTSYQDEEEPVNGGNYIECPKCGHRFHA